MSVFAVHRGYIVLYKVHNERTKITKRAFLIEHFWPSVTLAITTKNLPRMGNHLLNIAVATNDNNVEGVKLFTRKREPF